MLIKELIDQQEHEIRHHLRAAQITGDPEIKEDHIRAARKLRAIKDIVEYSLKQAGYQLLSQDGK